MQRCDEEAQEAEQAEQAEQAQDIAPGQDNALGHSSSRCSSTPPVCGHAASAPPLCRVDTFGQSLAASAAAAARARALAAPQQAPAPQMGNIISMHPERQPREMLFAVIRPELRSPARSPEVEMQLRCDEVQSPEAEMQMRRAEMQSPERSPEVEAILDEAIAMNTFPLAPYPEALQNLQPSLFSQLRLTSTKTLRPAPQRPSPLASRERDGMVMPSASAAQEQPGPLCSTRLGLG